MGTTPVMDTQLMYMQPGMMNPQFMGYDPNSQPAMAQGFSINPVEMQQQFYQSQMSGLMGG